MPPASRSATPLSTRPEESTEATRAGTDWVRGEIDTEDDLVARLYELLIDPEAPSEAPSPKILAAWLHGEGAGALHWGTGKAVSGNAFRRALRLARERLRAAKEAAADEAASIEASKPRSLTARAIAFGQTDPDATCPVECRVEGLGPQVSKGHLHEFRIITCDGTGRPKESVGETFFVAVRGTQKVRAKVRDNGDGTYSCTWTPPQSGAYQVAVSYFGVPLPGSPFSTQANPPLPFAASCAVSGDALANAVARATQQFEVRFRDRLGFTTHAVDLDVYVEPIPTAAFTESTSPKGGAPKEAAPAAAIPAPAPTAADLEDKRAPAGVATGKPQKPRKKSREGAPATAEDAPAAAGARGAVSFVPSPASARTTVSSQPPTPDVAARSGSTRTRCLRVKVRKGCPLVIREGEAIDSAQIGVVTAGQMVTVVYEVVNDGKTRAMIALDSISSASEVVRKGGAKSERPVGGSDASGTSRGRSTTPNGKSAITQTTSRSPEAPASCAPAPSSTPAERSDDGVETGAANAAGIEGTPAAGSGDTADSGSAQTHAEIAAVVAEHGVEALKGNVGWVTLMKDGKKLVTSRVKQSITSRHLHEQQWARRLATDRAVRKSAGGPSVSTGKGVAATDTRELTTEHVLLEHAADVSGIGFAFGGVYPGTLHSKGKVVDAHQVSYSIGLVGEYLLHVRLRQMAVALPGSPFRLHVAPNVAHASSTRLPTTTVAGFVGDAEGAGCGMTVEAFDLMGNACVEGGAQVTAEIIPKKGEETIAKRVRVNVHDNNDGTYALHWGSERSGTYTAAIKIFGAPVVGSPATIKLNSISPLLAKTELSGEGLNKCVSGTPSSFQLKFYDEHDNPALPTDGFKMGLALIQVCAISPHLPASPPFRRLRHGSPCVAFRGLPRVAFRVWPSAWRPLTRVRHGPRSRTGRSGDGVQGV